jgi:uncharacterized damage-inducible protein DinB
MIGLPEKSEAADYYFTYIGRISDPDIGTLLRIQLDETLDFLRAISEEKSLHRYAPEKWSIREVLNHLTDTERAFAFRALWFSRGFSDPLPSYDQNISAAGARANDFSWDSHLDDFQAVRQSTVTLFRNLPADAWMRTGIASGNKFTVRALAYIIAGHVDHHLAIVRERYL